MAAQGTLPPPPLGQARMTARGIVKTEAAARVCRLVPAEEPRGDGVTRARVASCETAVNAGERVVWGRDNDCGVIPWPAWRRAFMSLYIHGLEMRLNVAGKARECIPWSMV